MTKKTLFSPKSVNGQFNALSNKHLPERLTATAILTDNQRQ
ncbi:hypothetical protein ACKT08_11605 [Escherichia coli]